jgi:hypothetical protein
MLRRWLVALALARATSGEDCDLVPNSTTPQGLHLAFAGSSSTSIAISFFTCAAASAGPPFVLLSPEGSLVPTRHNGTSSRVHLRFHHDIVITGLQPGTRYTYRAGVGSGGFTSRAYNFSTAATSTSSFVAAVIGDMGVNGSAATVSRLSAASFDAVLHVGDVSYADDANLHIIEPSSGRGYEAVYDMFQRLMEPITSRAAYMVTPGNHDVTCKSYTNMGCPHGERNFSAFRYRFRMPSAESGASDVEHFNMWYSYRLGGVHFASVSTESDFPHAPTSPHTFIGGGAGGGFGDQIGWLNADLARARADPDVKWIVVVGHRPWYASKSNDWPLRAPEHIQAAFEGLLKQYSVDLYLCGQF